MLVTVSQEAEETLASLYAERKELGKALDMERALKHAAIASSEQLMTLHQQDQAASAEVAAVFQREMEAIRHQMEKLQSDLVQQSQTKNEAAGQVKKSLVQMNICIWWSFRLSLIHI